MGGACDAWWIYDDLLIGRRHLAIAGRTGHVASFDWQTGQLHTELQLRETCRDITCVIC